MTDRELLLAAKDFIVVGQCPLPAHSPFVDKWHEERDALIAKITARLSEPSDVVTVPREPKEGLLCGDVAISTDPRYAGFVFIRHIDGENWTTCAKMTPETWAMLDAAQKG